MSLQPNFSHIYVEDSARDYPLTDRLLSRFCNAIPISIKSYKEVFNRFKQDWRDQKESQKLIIAKKHGQLFYRIGEHVPNFGFKNFFYTSPVLNCLYDCDYCFLQGMYPSANMVVFVNEDDFFNAADECNDGDPLCISISYDTDLLALEGILPFCRNWIEYTNRNKNIHLEIRTKSANYKAIRELAFSERVVLAWTLTPNDLAKSFEGGAPSEKARLQSISDALTDGRSVRICLDPVVIAPGWEEDYRALVSRILTLPSFERLKDICIGSFRMNAEQFKRIQKQRPASLLINSRYTVSGGNIACDTDTRRKVKELFSSEFSGNFPPEKLIFHNL